MTTPATGTLSFSQVVLAGGRKWLPLVVCEFKHVLGQSAVVDLLIPHFLDSVKSAVLFVPVTERRGRSLKSWSVVMLRPVLRL